MKADFLVRVARTRSTAPKLWKNEFSLCTSKNFSSVQMEQFFLKYCGISISGSFQRQIRERATMNVISLVYPVLRTNY